MNLCAGSFIYFYCRNSRGPSMFFVKEGSQSAFCELLQRLGLSDSSACFSVGFLTRCVTTYFATATRCFARPFATVSEAHAVPLRICQKFFESWLARVHPYCGFDAPGRKISTGVAPRSCGPAPLTRHPCFTEANWPLGHRAYRRLRNWLGRVQDFGKTVLATAPAPRRAVVTLRCDGLARRLSWKSDIYYIQLTRAQSPYSMQQGHPLDPVCTSRSLASGGWHIGSRGTACRRGWRYAFLFHRS